MNLSEKEILNKIKTAIKELVPDAKVYLFGSRARDDWHEESDWDILVLTDEKHPKLLRWQIYDKLFPLSLETGSLFQFIVATKDEWENAPQLYALYKLANPELVIL